MTIKKTFGFGKASPYKSSTFTRFSQYLTQRNGLVVAPTLTVDVTDLVIGPHAFLQQGLITEVTDARREAIPQNLEAPYYLTATSPSNIEVDDVSFDFVKDPADLHDGQTILGKWDGVEWRTPDLIPIDGIIQHREDASRIYGHVGFNEGFGFSHNGAYTIYGLGAGALTDKAGYLTRLAEPRSFDAIPTDPTYERIDALLYRKPTDHPERIGTFKVVCGQTFVTDRSVFGASTTVGSGTELNINPKPIVLPDNTMALFWSEGYGEAATLVFGKLDETRTTFSVAPTNITTQSFGDYDVALMPSGNLAITYVRDGSVFVRVIDQAGLSIVSEVFVETVTTTFSNVRLVVDTLGFLHILVQCSEGGSPHLCYIKTNNLGEIAVAVKQVLSGINVSSYDALFDPDMKIHVAYANSADGKVYSGVLDEVGGWEEAPTDRAFGTQPQLILADNWSRYLLYLRDNKIWIWDYQQQSEAQETTAATDVQSFHAAVDGLNNLHLLYSTSTETREYALFLPTNDRRADPVVIEAAPTVYQQLVFDRKGALFVATATHTDPVSTNGLPLSASFFGPGLYGAELTPVSTGELCIPEAELLTLPRDPVLTDTIEVAGTASNDGTFTITGYRTVTIDGTSYVAFSLDGVTVAEAGAGTAQFFRRASAQVETRRLAAFTPYSFQDVISRELDSDLIYALITKPGNDIFLWDDVEERVDAAGGIRQDTAFLTNSGVISYNGGLLNWVSPFVIKDPLRGDLQIAAGNVTIAENEALFVTLPKPYYFAGDGDGAGANKTTLQTAQDLTPGMTVFVGDSDSPGITTTIVSITDRTIETAHSLAAYRERRGAYIIPTAIALTKETQNTGVLRPASDGTVDPNIFMIAYRTGGLVYFRDGALTLQDQESGHVGEGPTEELLQYIGATSEVDTDPNYTWNYGGAQGENITSRLGAVDLRTYEAAQDRNVRDLRAKDLEFVWDLGTQKVSWVGDDWRIEVPNVGGVTLHTVATALKEITLQEGQLAYVTIVRDSGAGDLTPIVCNPGQVPLDKDNRAHFVIAKRYNDRVYLGLDASLVLDTKAGSLIERADKTVKLVGGGVWQWELGTNTLSWDADAYFQHIGLPNVRNRLVAGSSTGLDADGKILYVDLNRKAGVAADLVVQAATIDTIEKSPHRYILARRIGDNIWVGHMLLEPGVRSPLERPYGNNAMEFIGQLTPDQVTHLYTGATYIQSWMDHETALAELDGRIASFFSAYPTLTPFRWYQWIADGSQSLFTIGDPNGYGDDTMTWIAAGGAWDVFVFEDGLKKQQDVNNTWPIAADYHHFIKPSSTSVRFKNPPPAGAKVTVVDVGSFLPAAEYVWLANGVDTEFDIASALTAPAVLLPFDPSNARQDIMVWKGELRGYQSPDSVYPIPDLVQYHDFIKLSGTRIKFEEPPYAGQVVVLRCNSPMPDQRGESHWYGDGVTDTFVLGSNSYGNAQIRWSSNQLINDIWVEKDGVFQVPSEDFVKDGAHTLRFLEVPEVGEKITVSGIDLKILDNKLDIYWEGSLVATEVRKINFRGSVSVIRPSAGEVDINVTGGGGGGGATMIFNKWNLGGATIPQYSAVVLTASNGIIPADNTVVGRKNPIGITLQAADPGDLVEVQFGGLVPGAIAGKGFGIDEEVFLGNNGALVRVGDIPDTGSPIDEVVKVGDVAGTGSEGTDLVWNKQSFGGR